MFSSNIHWFGQHLVELRIELSRERTVIGKTIIWTRLTRLTRLTKLKLESPSVRISNVEHVVSYV